MVIRWQYAVTTYKNMAQSAMTVRLDPEIKSQFDKLCQQFGMSANTAVNIFINQVIRSRSIPFVITASDDPAKVRSKALEAFATARNQAETSGGKELTLEEINEEIKKARNTQQ